MKNKLSAEEEIDNILGDVLDTMEEIDKEPTFITEEGKPKVNIEKFDKLLEAFDIGDGNMSANIQATRDDTMKELESLQEANIAIPAEIQVSIVNIDELMMDHTLVKEALREDIAGGRIVAAKLAEEIATADMDQLNGQVTEAYASIKKANVLSMKLLMDSYTMVAETQNKIKKLASELKTLENQDTSSGPNIENAIFVGSPAELLESLRK